MSRLIFKCHSAVFVLNAEHMGAGQIPTSFYQLEAVAFGHLSDDKERDLFNKKTTYKAGV